MRILTAEWSLEWSCFEHFLIVSEGFFVRLSQLRRSELIYLTLIFLISALVHGGVGGREDGGGLQWRDPNLPEVIGFLNSPSDVVKANAAAYLQHLTYMDDPNKQKTRSLGNCYIIILL